MFEIDSDVPPPSKNQRRKRSAVYRFDEMQVGDSFHIPQTADMPRPAAWIARRVSTANRKYRSPIVENGKPVTETVIVKSYARDQHRRRIRGLDGEFVVESEVSVEKPTFDQVRDFIYDEVGEDDPKGPGARVWRIK